MFFFWSLNIKEHVSSHMTFSPSLFSSLNISLPTLRFSPLPWNAQLPHHALDLTPLSALHCGASGPTVPKFCFTEGALPILTSNFPDYIFISFCILYQSHSKSFSLANIFLFLTSKAMHFFYYWYVPVRKYQSSLMHVLLSHHNLFISTLFI